MNTFQRVTFFKKEYFIIVLFSLITVSASAFPTVYKAVTSPKDRLYTLEQNYISDYYYYLSLMHQGYDGHWTITTRHTPEQFPRLFVQTFFALLGKLGYVTGGDMAIIYTVSRVVIGFALCLMIAFLAKRMFLNWSLTFLACFFAFFSTAFWYIANGTYVQYLFFWTEFDASARATFLPHHTLGTVFMIASILSLSLVSPAKTQLKKWIPFIGFGLLAGFINPGTLLNYLIALVPFTTVVLFTKSLRTRRFILPLFACCFVFGLMLAYFRFVQNSVFPWTTYRDLYYRIHYPIQFWEYVLGMGPVLVFAFFAIPFIWKHHNNPLVLMISMWAATPFVSIAFLPVIIRLPNVYYFQAAHYIPLSLLAAPGLVTLSRAFPIRLRPIAVTLILILLAAYFSYPWYHNIRYEITRYPNYPYNIYIPVDVMQGLSYLDKNSNEEAVVLSGMYMGGLLPAYTHNRSFLGHPANTYKIEEKEKEADAFYKQNDAAFARAFMKKYAISFVVFTFDAPDPVGEFTKELNLTPFYSNNQIQILKVNEQSL